MASSLNKLPLELIHEIISYLPIKSLCMLQRTCGMFYNLILVDSRFMYLNTLKFFRLYYYDHLFARFLLPYINPRYSFRSSNAAEQQEFVGNTIFHIVVAHGLIEQTRLLCTHYDRPLHSRMRANSTVYNQEVSGKIYLIPTNERCRLVDMVNEEPNTALHFISILPEICSEQQTLKMAQNLLNVANLWARGRAGNTVLCEASQHGQLSMVRLILDRAKCSLSATELKRYVNCKNDFDENAVILASKACIDIVKLLLECGGDANSMRSGHSLLHIICSDFKLDNQSPSEFSRYHQERITRRGQSYPRLTHQADLIERKEFPSVDCRELMGLLIEHGADVNANHDETGMAAIHVASFWGNTDAIEILVATSEATLSAQNPRNRWTALHYACSEVQIFAIQTLLSLGMDLFSAAIDENTDSALEFSRPPPPLELLSYEVVKTKVCRFAKTHRKRQI